MYLMMVIILIIISLKIVLFNNDVDVVFKLFIINVVSVEKVESSIS